MTSPVAHDHPDWARTVSATVVKHIDFNGVQAVGALNRGTFQTGNLPYVHVFLSADVGGALLRLRWKDAQSGGTTIAENRVHVRDFADANGSFPTLGPYVEVVTDVDAAPRTIQLKLWSALSAGHEVANIDTTDLLSRDGFNVVAGMTPTFDSLFVRWGWGHWTAVLDNGVDGLIRLYAVDFHDNVRLLDVMGAGISTETRVITLPPQPLRLSVFNADAVDRLLYAAVRMLPAPF